MWELHRRQGGFSSLVAIMITLSVVSFFFMIVGERLVTQQIAAQAEPFYERLLNLRDQIHAYQRDKYDNGTSSSDRRLFPQQFSDLSPGYIPACSSADNLAGLCSTIAQTPWNTDMTYVVQADTSFFPVRYRALVTIPLPDKADPVSEREYQVYADVLSRLVGARFNAAKTQIEWRINRVGDALAFDQFLKKDGSTPLDRDWNIGNHAITNAKGITVRAQNGKQQRIDGGIVKRYSLLIDGAGQWVPKNSFSCPAGLNQDVSAAYNGAISRPNYDYLAVGSNIIQSVPQTGGWQVSMTYNAKEKNRYNPSDKGTWVQRHRGQVEIVYLCLP